MIAATLSAIVFAAIFSAYLFMGRNLTRLTNTQQQLSQSRQALYRLSKDVAEATAITTATDTSLVLTTTAGTVTYTYTSGTQKLTRTVGATVTTLVTNLPTFTFAYYSRSGTTALTTPVTNANINIYKLEMRYTSAVGSSPNGTQSQLQIVSPRLVLRGKPILGQ
jgi:hypothetical protein